MQYYLYIVQVLSIAAAIAMAKHDAPAVIHFENKGVDPLTMSKFHRYNVWTKSVFCILCAVAGGPVFLDMFYPGILSALWIYLLFDPVLNKNRPGRGWDYLGTNDADGRRWIKWFGDNAGEFKAAILLLLIIGINVTILLTD